MSDLLLGYTVTLQIDCEKNLLYKIAFSKFQLSIGVAVLCLPWLRWAQPNLPRPIRVPMVFPIIYLLASLFVTIVPMYASPVETGYGVLMILSSVPVYFVCVAWKNKPKWFRHGMRECWEGFCCWILIDSFFF